MRKFLSSLLASSMILSTVGMVSAQELEQTMQPSEVLEQQVTKTLASGTCGANATWSLENGVLTISGTGPMTQYSAHPIDHSTAPWYAYCNNMTTLVIADGITSIGGHAFSGCQFSSATIPNSVTSIGDSAFSYCESLTSITIPDSVKTMERFAFLGCSSLTSVTLSNSITKLNQGTFYLCPSLTTITIPKSLKTIDSGVLGEVNYLSTVYYGGSEEDRSKISINSYKNDNIQNATWLYTAPPTFPDWATTFVDFIQPTIMPDISPENCNDPSNRGLIAQSLYNMSGNSANTNPTHSFSDVGDFGTAIAWCHAAEIMSGTGDTTFGTQGDVTREQFALILKKMATALEKETTQGDVSSLEGYADAWSISSWAQEGVAWAVANGLMEGADNALNPHGNVTRLEVSVMLSAFQNL